MQLEHSVNLLFTKLCTAVATAVVFCTACAAMTGCPGFDGFMPKIDNRNKLVSQSSDDHVRASSVLHAPTSAFLKKSGMMWPIAVGSIVDDGGNHIATATLISESHVLTVAHAFETFESQRYFILGFAVMASTLDQSRLIVAPDPGIRCFKLSRNVISSARGYLDYAVIGLEQSYVSTRSEKPQFSPLPVSSTRTTVGDSAHIVGLYDYVKEPVPVSGLTLLSGGKVGGRFSRVGRYTKDAGTAIQVDYWLETQPGHSGSPILDDKGRWVGMHQRNLNGAKCETSTPWHPYISEYYFDHFGGADSAARLKSECINKTEPNLDVLKRENILLPNGANLPRQGTLLVDIAINIERKMGGEWLCGNIPQFLALLHRRSISSTACKSDAFKVALDRMRLE